VCSQKIETKAHTKYVYIYATNGYVFYTHMYKIVCVQDGREEQGYPGHIGRFPQGTPCTCTNGVNKTKLQLWWIINQFYFIY